MSDTIGTPDPAARVHRILLTHFGQVGRAPGIETMAHELQLSHVALESALDILETQGAIYRDPQTHEMIAAYPFSARPTDHIVHLPDGHWVYAMCAIDALGMPVMLDTDAIIDSRCAHCGKAIRVTVKDNALTEYDPRDVRVWYMQPDDCCIAALDQCPSINFFCSAEHIVSWRANHPAMSGGELTMTDAFAHGVAVFGDLLKGKVDGPSL